MTARARVHRSRSLQALEVPHLFTTRRGGAGRRWDLTRVEGRDLDDLRSALGRSVERVAHVRQVHGAEVVEVGTSSWDPSTAADGLVSAEPGQALLVRTADCVPVLLARTDGARVAAVHAGWRGLVAGVVGRTRPT